MAKKSTPAPAMRAAVSTGRSFMGSGSGRWAGEQLLRALKEGKAFSPEALRTLDTLRKDEWKHLDEALVEEGQIRLRGVADLMAAGLTIPVANAMGRTIFEYEKVTDMNPAEVSLSGVARTEDDSQEFSLSQLPLAITHKDFNLNLRTLVASRTRGESLDTTQARTAGRLVAEAIENMYFNGGKQFGGLTIPGLTTHEHRNTLDFATAGEAWDAAGKTGEEILTDVLRMIAAAEADRFYGPYWLYVPSTYSTVLEKDFKANSDKSIRQRLSEVDRLAKIQVADQLSDGNVVLVQATRDVVALIEGEPLQTVQWDIEGGFIIKMKAFAIQIPLVRSDAQGRSGVVHMSAA